MDQNTIAKVEQSIETLKNSQSKVFFLVQDTKGNAKGSVRYIYQMAKSLKDAGMNPIILHESNNYTGVASWMGEEYMEIEHVSIEGQNLNLNLVLNGATASNSLTYMDKTDNLLTMSLPAGPANTSYENLSTLQRRLFSRILAAANVVANRGRRGPANFIVTNAYLASAMQDISQFTFAPFSNTLTQNNGTLYPVGSLAGMTVYVDQNMQYSDTRVCIGRKGGDDEPGLKFMPYMMAESIQTISEGTMSPKIAVKSRYALVEAGFHPETMYFTFYVNVPTGGLS